MPLVPIHIRLPQTGQVFDIPAADSGSVTMALLHSHMPDSVDKTDLNCWFLAGTGRKSRCDWVGVPDDQFLTFLLSTWAADAVLYYFVFRPRGKPSPNTKGGSPDQPANTINPFTQEEVKDLEQEVTISEGQVTIRVKGEYLLGFVKSKLAAGKSMNEIEIAADDVTVKLTTDVWVTCLLRSNQCQYRASRVATRQAQGWYLHKFVDAPDLLALVIDMCSAMNAYADRLKQLHREPDLFSRIKILVNDVLTYGKDPEAQERLESEPGATLYMSSVYFTRDEADRLLSFPGGTGLTLKQTLEVMMASKMSAAQSGQSRDFQICTSHDIAPVLVDHFGIRKGFQEERLFGAALKTFKKTWKKRRATKK
ncbi:hypothetical protein HDU89_002372 [Geranomyces variabilis]|nr:hypothetical protein HDU89_002372 [Geranomyces variabilis]